MARRGNSIIKGLEINTYDIVPQILADEENLQALYNDITESVEDLKKNLK